MKTKSIIILLIMPLFMQTPSFAGSFSEYFYDLKLKGYSFDNDGLSEAIIQKNQEAISLFKKAGIDFTLPDKEGYTALERAKMTKDTETFDFVNEVITRSKLKKMLISANTKPYTIKDLDNSEDLFSAVKSNNLAKTKIAVLNSINLNTLSEDGLAPLHYAVFNDNTEIVKLLLESGADVNQKTSDGMTPLDIAVLNLQKETAKIILDFHGGMSYLLAEELEEFGCQSSYNNEFNVYEANLEDIFNSMALAKKALEENKKENKD